MQKITPHLWFNKEAKEAAQWYTSLLPNSKVTHITTLHNTPSGDADVVSFRLSGYEFMAISAGPLFTPNPSISFMLNFDPLHNSNAREDLDALWNKLLEGGTVLMPLDTYPFSKRYGWVQDKYGISWQLILTDPKGEERPFLIPSFLFTKAVNGRAEEATDFYLSVFKNAKRGALVHYPQGQAPDKNAKVMFTDFTLENQWFVAMDGGDVHDFTFNEAISLMVTCDTQEEIDAYWKKLSAVPEAEQCGWLKDKYGVSWQIVPSLMNKLMSSDDPAVIDRVTKAFLPMKKLVIAELEKAAKGE